MTSHARLARLEEAQDFCLIEDDAGMLFRTCPGHEWIADLGNREPWEWESAIRNGLCWAIDNEEARAVGVVAARAAGTDLFVFELAVTMTEQGCGIGGRLLDAVETHARLKGLRAVTLTTFCEVPWNAPAYARRGYSRIEPAVMQPYIREVLAEEEANGLPSSMRCAMELVLAP